MTAAASLRRRCINHHCTLAAGAPTALHGVSTHIISRSGLHVLLRV